MHILRIPFSHASCRHYLWIPAAMLLGILLRPVAAQGQQANSVYYVKVDLKKVELIGQKEGKTSADHNNNVEPRFRFTTTILGITPNDDYASCDITYPNNFNGEARYSCKCTNNARQITTWGFYTGTRGDETYIRDLNPAVNLAELERENMTFDFTNGNLRLRVGVVYWEEDYCKAGYTYNSDCGASKENDDAYVSFSNTFDMESELLNNSAVVSEIENERVVERLTQFTDGNMTMKLTYVITYRIRAYSGNTLQVGNYLSSGAFQPTDGNACYNDNVIIRVPLKAGLSGGYFVWEYSSSPNGPWTHDVISITNYIERAVTAPVRYYRARCLDIFQALTYPSTLPDTWVPPLYLYAPAITRTGYRYPPDQIQVQTSTACGASAAVIQVKLPALPSGVSITNLKLQLKELQGNQYNFVSEVSATPAQASSAFFTVTSNAVFGKTYRVDIIADDSGCQSSSPSVTPQSNHIPSVTVTPSLPDCWNGTGSISVAYNKPTTAPPVSQTVKCELLRNGTVVSTLNIALDAAGNASPATLVFASVAPGPAGSPHSYTVKATRGTCNTTSAAVTIPAPAAVTANVTKNSFPGGYNARCSTDPVTFTVQPAGGTPNYTVGIGTVSAPVQTKPASLTGAAEFTYLLPPGVNTVPIFITDSKGCTITQNVSFVLPTFPLTAFTSPTAPSSSCSADGSLQVVGNGGVPYSSGSYQYSYGSVSSVVPFTTFGNLAAGEYTITVTDFPGCSVTVTGTVPSSGGPEISNVQVTNPTCNGSADGAISFSAGGGAPPYTEQLFRNNLLIGTGTSFTDLPAGTYTIVLTDNSNCTATRAVTVQNPAVVAISDLVFTRPGCAGGIGELIIRYVADPSVPGWFAEYSLDGGATWNYSNTFGDGYGNFTIQTYVDPGTYNVRVRTEFGCESNTVSGTMPALTPVTASLVSKRNASCDGSADGLITIRSQGGIPPYKAFLYRINGPTWLDIELVDSIMNYPANTNATVGGLTPSSATGVGTFDGGYFFVIYDSNPLNQPGSIGFNPCQRLTLPEGYYSYLACPDCPPDANPDYVPINLGTNAAVQIDAAFSIGDEIDCTGSNGVIEVSASGGLPPYQYSFTRTGGYQNSPILTGAGLYNTVYVRDAAGCGPDSAVVTIPEAPVTLEIQPDGNQPATGCTRGSQRIIISGGTPPYTVILAPLDNYQDICAGNAPGILRQITVNAPVGASQVPVDIDNLDPGLYAVCVRDNKTCNTDFTFDIADVPPLAIAVTSTVNESCRQQQDGAVTVTVTGGVPPYTVSRNFGTPQTGNGPTFTFANLPSETHSFYVTDTKNCNALTSTNVGANNEILLTITEVSPTCAGTNDGSIVIAPYNGVPPYSVSWDDDPNTVILLNAGESISRTGMSVNEYGIRISDGGGCDQLEPIFLDGPFDIFADVQTTPAACSGVANGSAGVTVFGGTPPYLYSVDGVNFQPDSLLQNLAAGLYTLYIRDAADCTGETQFLVEALVPIEAAATTTPASCPGSADGTLVVSAVNGTGPFTYSLDGATFVASPTFTGLTAGAYDVYVRDAAGCTSPPKSATVSGPPAITLASPVVTSVACAGGQNGALQVQATSGGTAPYQYSLDGVNYQATNQFAGLAAGSYTVFVRDAASCVQSFAGLTVPEPPALTVTTVVDEPASCGLNSGVASAAPAGGTAPYSFVWDDLSYLNQPVLIQAAPGLHTVVVTDANGCAQSQTVDVPFSPALTAAAGTITPDVCGQQIGAASIDVLTGTAPYTLAWSNGVPSTTSTAAGLAAGNYTVTVTDAFNCTQTVALTVGLVDGPSLAIVTAADALCLDNTGSITVDAASGTAPYTLAWSHDPMLTAAQATGLAAGAYTVTVTDANGCTATVVQSLSYLPAPAFASALPLDAACGQSNGSLAVAWTVGSPPLSYAWSHDPLLDNAIATQLPAGAYTVTVTDANGCTASYDATLADLPGPALAAGPVSASTCGLANGQATVLPTGGTAPYTYTWSHNGLLNSATAAALPAGDYTVTTTDNRGCTATATLTLTNIAGPQIAALTPEPSRCADGQGSLAVQAAAGIGTPPYQYAWSHDVSQTGSTVQNLFAGSYTVTVTDANQCTVAQTAAVAFVAGVQLAPLTIQNSLCTDGNGSVSLTVTPGAAPYTLTWSHDPGATGTTLQNLVAGTYTAVALDTNGCTATGTAVVEFEPAPTLLTPMVGNTSCGQAAGTITLAIAAGTGAGPFAFAWTGPGSASGNAPTGLPAGDYAVTVTDANGCSATTAATIEDSDPPAIAVDLVTPSDCGQANGAITVNATGVAPLQYQWSHNAFVQQSTAPYLTPGSYTVTVSDANGCSATISASVPDLPGITATAVATNAVCNDGTGTASITVDGSTSPFTYLWSHNALLNSAQATGLAAGSYVVTVTAANQCTAVVPVTIGLDASPALTALTTASACTSATGAVELTPTGGVGPFVYAWSQDGQLTGPSAANLAPGSYTATVTDANGCTGALDVEVPTVSGPAAAPPVAVEPGCGEQTGSLSLAVSGGTLPYTFAWSHDVDLTGSTAAGLGAGVYAVTVTDAGGCTQTQTYALNNAGAPAATISGIQAAYCGQATGTATASVPPAGGPYTYQWVGAANPATVLAITPQLTNVQAGTYFVSATGAGGCITVETVEIPGAPAFSLQADVNQVTCNGQNNGSIAANVAMGGAAPFTYLWTTGASTNAITGLTPGVYTVTVTDATGCTQTAVATVSQPAALSLVVPSMVNPACNGGANGSITVAAAGGMAPYQYNWGATTGPVNNNLPAGSYTVTATDAAGCSASLSVTLLEQLAPVLTLISQPPTCAGTANGSITASASGGVVGLSYTWSNGQTTPTAFSLSGGIYTVTVTNTNNCSAIATATLSAPPPIAVLATVNVPACGSAAAALVTAAANGGTGMLGYQWNDPLAQTTPQAVNLGPGTYTVQVNDQNGCTATAAVTVNAAPAVTAAVVQTTSVSCPGAANGSAIVAASGGTGSLTYQWSDPQQQNTAQAIDLAAGAYGVTVIDAVGCSATATATVGTATPFVASIAGVQAPSCNGLGNGSAGVFIGGGNTGFSFQWSDPAAQTTATAVNLAAGAYSVTVTSPTGCTQVLTANVPAVPALALAAGTVSGPTCAGLSNGQAQVLASGGTGAIAFAWSDPAGQASATAFNLLAGAYTVTATDANGCTATLSVTVPVTPALTAQVAAVNAPLCAGQANGTAQAAASGGTGTYAWLWGPNAQTTPTATNLLPGTYSVTVTDQNGCTASTTATVPTTPALQLSLATSTPPTCSGLSNGALAVAASGGTGSLTYTWSTTPAQTGPSATNLGAGSFTVTVSDANGCTLSSQYTLQAASAIAVAIAAQQPTCSTTPNGSATATVSGGTPGYTFTWSDNQSGSTASGLTAGTYSVTVSDQNGCSTVQQTTITALNPAITAGVASQVAPGCAGATDGTVTLTAAGGTGQLSFAWNIGGAGFQRTNLPAGAYTVTVTDVIGCTATVSAVLADGPVFSLPAEIGDTVLCDGGSLFFDLPTASASYSWSGPGSFTATGGSIVLTNSGTYQVSATHPSGCSASAAFDVTVLDQPFAPLFVVATDVVRDQEVVAVEVSWPVPTAVEWIYSPDSVELIGQERNEYVFRFLQTGPVNLTLRAGIGTCVGTLTKKINVVATPAELPNFNSQAELVRFVALPNPTTGPVTIEIEFAQPRSGVLTIYRPNGQLVTRRLLNGSAVYQEALTLPAVPGVYSAILQIDGRKYAISIVVAI